MTFGVMGSSPFGPFTKLLNQIVLEKVRDTWNINNPTVEPASPSDAQLKDQARAKLGLEWTQGEISKVYEMRFIARAPVPTGERSEGYRMEAFFQKVEIHVFVRRDDITVPAQALNMLNEVKRIMHEQRGSFGQGIQHIDPVELDLPVHDPENYGVSAYWHWKMTYQAHYFVAHTT